MEESNLKLPRRRFNPNTVNVESLMQMMRLTSLQRLQNKLRIVQEENPALYTGMVKTIWSAIERKKKISFRYIE